MSDWINEPVRDGEGFIAELPGDLGVSLRRIGKADTSAAGIAPKTLISKVIATGKFKAATVAGLFPAEGDATEEVVGFNYYGVPKSTVEQKVVCWAEFCVINDSHITWPAGITNVQKASVIATLEARKFFIKAAQNIASL